MLIDDNLQIGQTDKSNNLRNKASKSKARVVTPRVGLSMFWQ